MLAVLTAAAAMIMIFPAVSISTEGAAGDIANEIYFGGYGGDCFISVIPTTDGGFVAVGDSGEDSFGKASWKGVAGKGGDDAIIVKFKADMTVEWAKNFGGTMDDCFYDVTEAPDGGYVAVGCSYLFDGDWAAYGVTGRGHDDSIIVKFNSNGSVAWAKNFGGSSTDQFFSVTTVPDGYIAVGDAVELDGDWAANGIMNKWGTPIVKFNLDGSVAWAKNFGGTNWDVLNSVIAVPDGFVAVGFSTGFDKDWGGRGITGKGDKDATIIKFDNSGSVVWAKNFGGSGEDVFESVIAVPDGFVAVGYSNKFNKDWTAKGVSGKGSYDATIVKFDNDGSVVWAKNFGGSRSDSFLSVTAVSGGFVAVGSSEKGSFSNGDWMTGEDSSEPWLINAIMVRFNNEGIADMKKGFSEVVNSELTSVTVAPDGYIAAGFFYATVFNAAEKEWKTDIDAAIMKIDHGAISVTKISGIPASVDVGTDVTLTGTVVPSDASKKTITWALKDAGTTEATLTDGVLSTAAAGTVVVTATIADGTAAGDYVKDFTITVKEPDNSSSLLWIGMIAVIGIILIGAAAFFIKKKMAP